MPRKSFTEKIKQDFRQPVIGKETAGRAKTKAFSGARFISIDDILPDGEQPRRKFDEEKIRELAASIKSKGLIEPITVRHDEKGYVIITGERRFKASQLAGLKEVPCIIKEIGDQEAVTYQLIENLQRENLNPVEEARALKRLTDNGVKQTEVAKLIGKSQPYVSQSLKILSLPKDILEKALEEGTPKDVLLRKLEKPKKVKGRPKAKPFVWEPKDRSFKVEIKIKKKDYSKEDLVKALFRMIEEIQQQSLFGKNSRKPEA